MQLISGVNFKCVNFNSNAKSSVSFGARKPVRDEFIRTSSPVNSSRMDEKKFQAKFKSLGMSQEELENFLSEYRRGTEKNIQNALEIYSQMLTPEVKEIIEMMDKQNRADKFYRTVYPNIDIEKYCIEMLQKLIAPVKNVNEFANWYSDNSYKQYRNTQIKICNEIRKNTPVNSDEKISQKIEEYIELIKTYNEAGAADDILNEFLLSPFSAEVYETLATAPKEDYQKLIDVMYPSINELSKNKVALCSYIYAMVSGKVSTSRVQEIIDALSVRNFDKFFASYEETKVPKSTTPEIEKLKKLTRTSDEEIASLEDSLDEENKEETLQRVLQLKLYLGKIAEFYEKQINLVDLCEIYQFGILQNDIDKTCEILSRILENENSTTIQNIARHLLEKQEIIFEDLTIERKFFGELQAPNLKAQNSNANIRISYRDKIDLISTGFFAQKIIDYIKNENIVLNKSPKTTKFISKDLDYSSLTNLEHHQICEELAKEYQDNAVFARAIDSLFNDRKVKQEAQEILAYVEYLSEVISGYLENLREKDIDKDFLDQSEAFFGGENKQIGFDFMKDTIENLIQKETEKRPRVFFTKHAILRLIGRDLIQPRNSDGENLDFYSFLTKVYYNATKNKTNDFVITDLNGYSGLCVKTKATKDEITIVTLF